jgi:predicted transcriptional regulator
MKIENCMKKKVITVSTNASIAQAAEIVVTKRAGILPVIDENGKPEGMIRISDLISLVMPEFIHLVDNLDFVPDFGAIESSKPNSELLSQPVTSLMEPLITIEQRCGLLRAYAIMLQNNLFDLVVTDSSGKLVGLVSRVDVGTAIISLWLPGKKQ